MLYTGSSLVGACAVHHCGRGSAAFAGVSHPRDAPCRGHVQTEPALRQYACRVCYVSNIHERHAVRSSARQPCHERADVGDSRDCVPVQRVCARDVRRAIRRREDAPRDSHTALTGRLHGPHVRASQQQLLLCALLLCCAAAAGSAVRCNACLLEQCAAVPVDAAAT